MRVNGELLNRIKLICPVQSLVEKYFAFAVGQIKFTTRAIPSQQRGVSRSSRTWGGMRWTLTVLLTRAPNADGEVVWS